MSSRNRRTLAGLLVAVLAAIVTWYVSGDGGSTTTQEPQTTPTVQTTPSYPPSDLPTSESTSQPSGDVDPDSGLSWIAEAELPPEALKTLQDIDNGGPYDYPGKDDTTFTNAEGLLPDHDSGYYREYTVETPGSPDRGARRIVTGDGGEFYYTDDHYDSFRRIAR
jgi:ribonuclease T1